MLKNFIGGFFIGPLLLIALVFALMLGGCSKAAPARVVVIPTPVPTATPVPTPAPFILYTGPTPAPAPKQFTPPVQSQSSALTVAEVRYIGHYKEVMNLVTSAESKIKGSGNAKTRLAMAEAEIASAWQKHLSFFQVPPRFITANEYLAQGLMKERAALRSLSFGLNDGEDEYAAAGELFKASAREMKRQLQNP